MPMTKAEKARMEQLESALRKAIGELVEVREWAIIERAPLRNIEIRALQEKIENLDAVLRERHTAQGG
jgi:hypothetical protein